MSEIDPAVVKKTQDLLGKFVKRPPLTEKLLKKPPFRFLHDIINVLIKETGFVKGLYSTNELNSENIKDRDAKIKFLHSLIEVVKLVTGEEISARPSKIVAGQEPEKTNELLQIIGRALEQKLDTKEAVATIKNGSSEIKEKTSSKVVPVKTKPTEKVRAEKPASKEKKTVEKIIKPKEVKSKEPEKTKPKVVKKVEKSLVKTKKPEIEVKEIQPEPEPEPEPKPIQIQEKPKEPEVIQKIEVEVNAIEVPPQKEEPPEIIPKPSTPKKESKIPIKRKNSAEELEAIIDEEAERRRQEKIEKRSARKLEESKLENKNVLEDQSTIVIEKTKKLRRKKSEDNKENHISPTIPTPTEETEKNAPNFIRQKTGDLPTTKPRTTLLRPPSVRPSSARPGAPRRRDKNVEIILPPDETVQMGNISIKVESFQSELEDDGENLIIIEDPVDLSNEIFKTVALENANEAEQGHLLKQILETQKEFSVGGEDGSSDKNKTDWDDPKRQSSAKQMDSLRESIQKLTRSVNPLGKLLDFLQEDIDSMQRELSVWKETNRQTNLELNKERGLTENAIEPIKHQLIQIESSIKEYNEMINITRSNIMQNEQKINKILTDI